MFICLWSTFPLRQTVLETPDQDCQEADQRVTTKLTPPVLSNPITHCDFKLYSST